MRNLFVLLLIAVLLSCSPSAPIVNLSSVDIAGATGLYLEGSTLAHGRMNGPNLSITASGGAVLMKLTASTPEEATFLDEKGEPVTVEITRTLQLNADYLLLEYSLEGETGVCVVTLADGDLRELSPLPADWARIRVKAGDAYYISGGVLYRVDLATLTATAMSGADNLPSASVLFIDGSGDVHTFYLINGMIDPANQLYVYYADGSPRLELWGTPEAYRMSEFALDGTALEDEPTGEVYYVRMTGPDLAAEHITFDASGVHEGAPQVLLASASAPDLIAPAAGKPFLGNVAHRTGGNVLTVTVAAGAITGATTRAFVTLGQPTVYQDGMVYTASAAGIETMEMASGTSAHLLDATGITEIDVVGEDLFFATGSEVYQRKSTGEVELYSAAPVDIETVLE